ncbi:MAG: class I SAM-dependent rRNA methyltransferase [Bacteroidales bacterium]|nr:class I SAM-dependent rRNA methyltransferase [Bacteroidales bacterium]
MHFQFPKVTLKSGRERSLERFHLWVFSGAIKSIAGKPSDGDIVEVYSNNGEYLATGHFQNGSIMVRIFSFQKTEADNTFWQEKFLKAINFRRSIGFFDNPETNVFRLIHGEGDGFPGLIVDFYNGVAVLQAHSVGMYQHRELFAEILTEILGEQITAVYDKSEGTLNTAREQATGDFLKGSAEKVIVLENGNQFEIDIREGQKTGFFIDQRENRKLLQGYCNRKKVANLFSYTGGFSVYAGRGRAIQIDSVDASEKAVHLAQTNMELNFGQHEKHRFLTDDVFDFLRNENSQYDVIVLDPPAFAKHRQSLDNALKAYRRLNEAAIRKLTPGGVLFTFSCSQVVTPDDFRLSVFAAAAAVGRPVRILQQMTQPADHPINIYHPEGQYLKGLVLFVE